MKAMTVLVLVVTFNCWAARTVVLTPNGSSELRLTNPSSVNVSYTVDCFNASGASVFSSGAKTLNPGKTWKMAPTCAGGSNPGKIISISSGTGGTAVFCPAGSNINYSQAANQCDTGYTLATIAQIKTLYIYNSSGRYWFSPGSTNWYYKYSGSTISSYTDNATTVAPTAQTDYQSQCVDGSSNWVEYCSPLEVSSTAAVGAVCYTPVSYNPMNGPSFCRVQITSGDANAYLTSPWFKGGSPF